MSWPRSAASSKAGSRCAGRVRRPAIVLPGREPSQLIDETVARTQAALKDTLNDLKRALVAALRPVRDRETLDAVTRHLERKVEGLKELLEARTSA